MSMLLSYSFKKMNFMSTKFMKFNLRIFFIGFSFFHSACLDFQFYVVMNAFDFIIMKCSFIHLNIDSKI